MIVCGSALTSVAWAYPFYICSARYAKYGACVSMTGLAIITVVPPFVVNFTRDHISYPMFFFFGAYLMLSIFLNAKWMPHDYEKNVE